MVKSWLLIEICTESTYDFGFTILYLHMITEVHLNKYYSHSEVDADADTKVSVGICRKLSRYMMYLLVTQPLLLPLATSALTLKHDQDFVPKHYQPWARMVVHCYIPYGLYIYASSMLIDFVPNYSNLFFIL